MEEGRGEEYKKIKILPNTRQKRKGKKEKKEKQTKRFFPFIL
jgi:hypothetical protein